MKAATRLLASIAMPMSLLVTQTAAAAEEKPASAYVQCDGSPNNMTAGESAARIVGAITLLGLFAPPPENADPSKRKFGADGVAVCSTLIDGEKREGNPNRRVDLILARAIHQIEAKNYDAAVTDAKLARSEAQAAGLLSNPYYARSQGRAPDLIEAAALYRMDKTVEARAALLRDADTLGHSYFGLITLPSYMMKDRSFSPEELAYWQALTQSSLISAPSYADRLEDWGRFADSAKVRDARTAVQAVAMPDDLSSALLAQAAIAHALAGDKAGGAERAAQAKANFDKRIADGKPEKDQSRVVELLDLYDIIAKADAGDMKTARRLFSGRSRWVEASFGAVVEVTSRLRQGAVADDLIGALAKSPDELWKDRTDALRAETLAKDSDNKTLFYLLPGTQAAGGYRSMSSQVWRTDKSKLLLKPNPKIEDKFHMERLFLYTYSASFSEVLDAYPLHAALLAKSRGQKGFVIYPIIGENLVSAAIITGNPGDPGMDSPLFNDAEETIARLSPLIPDPVTLKQIKAQESAKKK